VTQFLDFMLADFGIPCETKMKSQVLLRFNQWLLEQHQAGRTAVLVVDEAQNLSPQVLEEIRLLTNLETSSEKLLQIILAGQPELELKLSQPQLRQFRQRITLRCKTHPLTREETSAYVLERLRIAGADGHPIFTPEALATAHNYSKGIPRVVNLLCEHALISGFVDQQPTIGPKTIEEVAREFELHQPEPAAPAVPSGENLRLMEALQGLATLMDRLRRPE
jgi:general secretion pathway protein A